MDIKYSELEIQTFNHGTCVQIKHIPTNITVQCFNHLDERQNRRQALEELEKKIKHKREIQSFIKKG